MTKIPSYCNQLDFPLFATESGSVVTPRRAGNKVALAYVDVRPADQAFGIQPKQPVALAEVLIPANEHATAFCRQQMVGEDYPGPTYPVDLEGEIVLITLQPQG